MSKCQIPQFEKGDIDMIFSMKIKIKMKRKSERYEDVEVCLECEILSGKKKEERRSSLDHNNSLLYNV